MQNGYHGHDMMVQVTPTPKIMFEGDDDKSSNVELKKHVGLVSGTALIVGTMIGKMMIIITMIIIRIKQYLYFIRMTYFLYQFNI